MKNMRSGVLLGCAAALAKTWTAAGAGSCAFPVDLLLAQDVSNTAKGALPNSAKAMKDIMQRLEASNPSSRVKITTFTDQPLYPYGCQAADWITDHAFNDRIEWTSDKNAVYNLFNNMSTEWGVDTKEAQLLHLAHIADAHVFAQSPRTAVPDKLQKVVFITSDFVFHEEGDLATLTPEFRDLVCTGAFRKQCCHLRAGVTVSPYTPGAELFRHDQDENHYYYVDYPAMDYTARRLAEENISVIFLLSRDVYGHTTFVRFMDAIRNYGGYSSSYLLNMDSTNLYDALTLGLSDLAEHVC